MQVEQRFARRIEPQPRHPADDDAMVAAVMFGVQFAGKGGLGGGQDRQAVPFLPFGFGKAVDAALGKALGDMLAIKIEDVDGKAPGLAQRRQRRSAIGRAEQQQRRIERDRGEAVGRQPGAGCRRRRGR